MSTGQELPIVEVADQEGWRQWLEANHADARGLWLKLAKKGSPTPTVTYGEAIEEALCYGWIDGQVRAHDSHFYLQRFTPRRARSKWSQINREKATRLIAGGRMMPAGVAQVEAAQADGRWEAAQADGRWEAAYPARSPGEADRELHRAAAQRQDAAGLRN
jgi:uncharacterized protein YdeI (YjbR/CyaY-like superfamily)